jgi:hypothetical protein
MSGPCIAIFAHSTNARGAVGLAIVPEDAFSLDRNGRGAVV